MKTKLDSFERQIERSAESYRPVSKKDKRKLEPTRTSSQEPIGEYSHR